MVRCQQNYVAAARAVGLDPATSEPVACNVFDKTYVQTLYDTILDVGERAAGRTARKGGHFVL